jgi:hypothetical protein
VSTPHAARQALGEGEPRTTLADWDTFFAFLRTNVISNIFQPSKCGDNTCDVPDEHPAYYPAEGARQGETDRGFRGLFLNPLGPFLRTSIPFL